MSFREIEKLDECPFNPVHQILPHRMASHIAKCWKNHPDADVKRCVFNATHVVKTPLYQAHILECPDRAIVERDLYHRKKIDEQARAREQLRKALSAEVYTTSVDCNEDWDSELVISTYNPAEHVVYKEMTRPPPPGLGKASRRAWRAKEIERVQRLKDGKPIDDLIMGETEGLAISASSQNMDGTSHIGVDQVAGMLETMSFNKKQDEPVCKSKCPVMQYDNSVRRPRIAADIFKNVQGTEPTKVNEKKVEVAGNEDTSANFKEIIKQKRKLEKLLVGITRLEQRIANGHQPSSEEQNKVSRRGEIEEHLAKLLDGVNLDK